MVTGFSKNLRNSASHCAPTAPSTTRWSQLSVTAITLATSNLPDRAHKLHRFRITGKTQRARLVATHGPFLVVRRDEPLLRAPDGEDAGLGGVDDGGEVLDAEHPQIGDCESASLEGKK